jgi:hypothetical protein
MIALTVITLSGFHCTILYFNFEYVPYSNLRRLKSNKKIQRNLSELIQICINLNLRQKTNLISCLILNNRLLECRKDINFLFYKYTYVLSFFSTNLIILLFRISLIWYSSKYTSIVRLSFLQLQLYFCLVFLFKYDSILPFCSNLQIYFNFIFLFLQLQLYFYCLFYLSILQYKFSSISSFSSTTPCIILLHLSFLRLQLYFCFQFFFLQLHV